MQRTLLQVVQSYLDRTSGFYVDSIFETDESQQVAKIGEDVFYRMLQEYPNLLFTMQEMTLDSLADTTKPNYLSIPQRIQKIQESKIYYNVSRTDNEISFKEIKYLPPTKFTDYVTTRGTSTNTETVIGFDGSETVVPNKQWPTYCTSFDNKYVVFDSYHSDYDTVLQSSKTKIVASSEPVFLLEDDFVIPIPDALSETYLDMVLDECMNFVYQQPNPILNQRARAARIKLQQDNRALGQSRGKKSYGRRGPLGYIPRGHRYE